MVYDPRLLICSASFTEPFQKSTAIEDRGFIHLIKREFPVCKGGGESKVLRSRTSPARTQLGATPVKARESILKEKQSCTSRSIT